MSKVGVLHENAPISRRFWRKLISLRSILADYIIIYIADKLQTNADDILLKTVEDSIIWLKLKGSYFGLKNDLFLCLCYNIPSGSSREVFSESNVFDLILDDMSLFENKYEQCNFLITGDLNA